MNWKTFRKDFKRWNNRGLKDVICPDYVFNKWIFYCCLFVVVLTGLFIINNHDWDFSNKFYFYCPENGPVCSNPFYNSDFDSVKVDCPVSDVSFCNAESFLPGFVYGVPISRDVELFPVFCLSVFGFGFVLNHLLFNGHKKIKNEVLK